MGQLRHKKRLKVTSPLSHCREVVDLSSNRGPQPQNVHLTSIFICLSIVILSSERENVVFKNSYHILCKFPKVEIKKLALTFEALNLALWVKCLKLMVEAEHYLRSWLSYYLAW